MIACDVARRLGPVKRKRNFKLQVEVVERCSVVDVISIDDSRVVLNSSLPLDEIDFDFHSLNDRGSQSSKMHSKVVAFSLLVRSLQSHPWIDSRALRDELR